MVSLRQNSLEGTIPSEFFDELINMTMLDLGQNHLSGTLPTSIGKVRNLRSLNLGDNSLSGSIPTEIAHIGSAHGLGWGPGGWEGLTTFVINHNNLTHVIPTEIGYLENIVHLDLSDNPSLGLPSDGVRARMHARVCATESARAVCGSPSLTCVCLCVPRRARACRAATSPSRRASPHRSACWQTWSTSNWIHAASRAPSPPKSVS